MTLENAQRLSDLTEQLSETLMTATICADEILTIVREEDNCEATSRYTRFREVKHRKPGFHRPLVDNSTYSVFWAGKTCRLRRTILFRLAERLARQPNQYISADQLLHDVWEGGIKSPDTIRSAVRNLRKRLTAAGMSDLATAIHGTGGRYGLMLDGNV